jgi:hypothetical protein
VVRGARGSTTTDGRRTTTSGNQNQRANHEHDEGGTRYEVAFSPCWLKGPGTAVEQAVQSSRRLKARADWPYVCRARQLQYAMAAMAADLLYLFGLGLSNKQTGAAI